MGGSFLAAHREDGPEIQAPGWWQLATRPMLNFKSFRSASSVLAGIELIHMIRKGQFDIDGAEAMSFADQFSTIAGVVRPV
jgi:hypothetical protein